LFTFLLYCNINHYTFKQANGLTKKKYIYTLAILSTTTKYLSTRCLRYDKIFLTKLKKQSMKKICFNIYVLLCAVVLHAQNVGIGTTTPNNSAIVDITSSSKGLLLPRLADTASVATPATGLVIYNQNTKSPNYYDGAKWKDVADARNNFVPLQGNITYTITGTTAICGISVDAGPLVAIDYYNISTQPRPAGGGGGSGRPSGMDSIIIYKEFGGNSIFLKECI
jgi:hypothetical protein